MNFVDAHDFSVGLVLRVLGIPASTYYDWRKSRRAPSRRAIEDAELLRLIDEIRGEHEFAGTYGSPRVWLELRRRGVRVGCKRVERIMRRHGIRARVPRRYRVCTTDSKHSLPVAANLLDRNFVAEKPDQVWLADITYIPTGEGWLYLAIILDLFTRKVVGWAMREHMRAELTGLRNEIELPELLARPDVEAAHVARDVVRPNRIVSVNGRVAEHDDVADDDGWRAVLDLA